MLSYRLQAVLQWQRPQSHWAADTCRSNIPHERSSSSGKEGEKLSQPPSTLMDTDLVTHHRYLEDVFDTAVGYCHHCSVQFQGTLRHAIQHYGHE